MCHTDRHDTSLHTVLSRLPVVYTKHPELRPDVQTLACGNGSLRPIQQEIELLRINNSETAHSKRKPEWYESEDETFQQGSHRGKPRARPTVTCGSCGVGRLDGLGEKSTSQVIESGLDGCCACARISRFLKLSDQQDRDRGGGGESGHFRPCSSQNATEPTIQYEYFVKVPVNEDGGLSVKLGADPSESTSSPQAFATLKHWISNCATNHNYCRNVIWSRLPHRVLKIYSIEPMVISLVENDPSMERYACLSYRWGQNTAKHSLKSSNLSLYKNRVPDKNIYPLVRDAMIAAWRLGLHYIWIDSYCIVQDDEADWHREAASMGDIYENAFITLSATSATDGGRLFSKPDPLYRGYPITELEGVPVLIRRCIYHPRVTDDSAAGYEHLALPKDATESTLSRGWVFQERVLSRRFVHFLKDELFWECRESTWCECRSQEMGWFQRRLRVPRLLKHTTWGELIQDYCDTVFTYEKDRLEALSGVARRYGALNGKSYLAGNWFEDLPRTFLWDRYLQNGSSVLKPRPLSSTSPSWSWTVLSAQGELPTNYYTVHSTQLSFIRYQRYPNVLDVYADRHSVSLTVSGPTVMGTIYPGEGYVRALGVLWHMAPDFNMQAHDASKFRVVGSGSEVLILVGNENNASGFLILQDPNHHNRLGIIGTGDRFERIGILGDQLDPKTTSSEHSKQFFPSSDDFERQKIPMTGQEILHRADRRTLMLS